MEEMGSRRDRWGRLKIFAGMVMVAFAVTLALIVGNRLSDESLAVLAGAVCGVGAAIPTSLLIVTVSRRREEYRVQPPVSPSSYPPVVVVTPSAGQQRFGDWNTLPPSLAAPVQRQFTVVGGGPVHAEVMPDERYS
jgi:hypothetical protein